VVTESDHPPRLIAGTAQRRTEWRANEDPCSGDCDKKHNQRRDVKGARTAERNTERRWTRRDGDPVIAVRQADPAISETPNDLAERQRDHDEGNSGRPQRQRGEACGRN